MAAFLEGMSEVDYRHWLCKRLHLLSKEALAAGEIPPLVRPISKKIAKRHKRWELRRDDWRYVYETSLTPPARHRLERLRRREETVDVIEDGQVEAENAVRISLIETALWRLMPGLLDIHLPARAFDVRPCVSTRTLMAHTARRVTLLRDDAALRKFIMHTEDIVEEVAGRAGLSRKQAESALHAILQTVMNAMIEGTALHFTNFGTFCVVQRAPRAGRHPKTKAPLLIPARKAVVFRAANKIQRAVNA